MNRRVPVALALGLLLGSAGEPRAACPEDEPESSGPFAAEPSLLAFDEALRDLYAYGDGVDREALLVRLRAAAGGLDRAGLRELLNRAALLYADPHLLVGPLTDADLNVWPTSADLVVERGADGRFVVVDVRAGSAADAAAVRPGWTAESVEGVPLEAAVAGLWEGLVDEISPAQASWGATLLVNGRRSGARRVRFAEGEVELANPRELARAVAARDPVTTRVEDGVAVIRIENALGRDETVAAFDRAMGDADRWSALILDLRNTPSGGNTDVARGLLGWFTDAPAPYQMHTIPFIQRTKGVPRRFVEYVEPRGSRFAGPVVVLGGRWTGSMGEGMVIGMDALGAHTICSDLGDLLGGLHSVPLEDLDATLELGAEALFHVNGTPREEYVCDEPLAAADRGPQGGDPALDAALKHLQRPRVTPGR